MKDFSRISIMEAGRIIRKKDRDTIESWLTDNDVKIYIDKQKYLFSDIRPLFVSRYPQNQSKDLIKWLQSIPNPYVHFGDFDFAGIGIYLHEFKKHLVDRTTFFVPENIDKLITDFGNKKRYDEQKINFDVKSIKEEKLLQLIKTIHKNRKGLDQEILIKE